MSDANKSRRRGGDGLRGIRAGEAAAAASASRKADLFSARELQTCVA